MMTIIFNNATTLDISSYNRSISIDNNGVVQSSASVGFVGENVSEQLIPVAETTISSIEVQNDGVRVYRLTNQNAKLTDINESIYDGIVHVSASIYFNTNSESSVSEY